MSRVGFHKSLRMFRKFSEETLRRRGTSQMGREGVAALVALDAVLKAERLLDGSLLEPLAAFTNLLQSSQLPPEFGGYSFGDALLAIEEAHAELRQNDEQLWEFSPQLQPEALANLADFLPQAAELDAAAEHAAALGAQVLQAMRAARPGSLVVVGALRAGALPLAQLAAHFERLTLSDLELPALEALVRRDVPEALRGKVRLERYDVTGSYVAFAEGASRVVAEASDVDAAQAALLAWLQSYDVGAGSAGLTEAEGRADLAISAMVLSTLGRGYGACIARALRGRGFAETGLEQAPLAPALELLSRLIEQHHIHALLRRAEAALLVSAVSEVTLGAGPGGQSQPVGEPHDLLGVERLTERLPQMATVKDERSWEWRRPLPGSNENRSLLTLVEAVLV